MLQFGCVLSFRLAVAVIKASELWAAMEPELLVTVRAELEPSGEAEVEEEVEDDDRATGVKIAQYLRVNKYRYCSSEVEEKFTNKCSRIYTFC